ncbi:transglutaminase-like domain-containing protein [Geomonas subterranea]|uniref:Transglutaminase-like domain-containing protein n=1 Tax=Geomonas subterranea TaxID=2847989 RepID=A0ABX8LJH0_9BACT|nr:transglutaminase-like domain-containing protein [Geomonas subterranea]QXE92077.1 transglutaminase-like domain-containing protein [Geomonas subterranea]QXM09830.1 transglutaminase-like domain-containing protein [Geomonas subterranea]
MKRLLLTMLAFSLCLTPAAWAKSRSGQVSVEVDLSKQEAGKETRLWIPYAVSDANQKVTDVKVSGDFATSAVYTDQANGTPILYAQWDKDAKSRKLVYSFTVQREEQRIKDLAAKEPAWNKADYAEYLKPTSLGPVDGEVKKLAEGIVKGKTTVLEKAKAIYDWACENMYRDPATVGCGKGDVCELLKKPGGKCTDISSVYIALARAAGVPAREVFGLRLGKKAEEDITTWQHCWVEFFLPGTGWVPVDPADVRKAMLVEKLELKDAKTREYRDYFWGGIDPYRFKIASGRDVVLNPQQAGAPLNTFGYPYAEVGGKVLDWYDPKGFSYRITFKEK